MKENPIVPYHITTENLLHLIDSMYDELLIYDNQYMIVYINEACSRHYGYLPEEMIGKSFFNFVNDHCWDISILPVIYDKKKPYSIRQKTINGSELFTIAMPIFDEAEKISYVVMNVRDKVSSIDLYNPGYLYQNTVSNHTPAPKYESEEMRQVMQFAERISQADVCCILTGESGTGKTMIARYIHSVSPRNSKPFISLNCASIPNELVESELFGYTRGAFTGASSKGKPGLFEAADGGTLLLDEIGELCLSTQAKLLHVLQDQEYIPIGASKPVKINVRILAATNKNLRQMVINGLFREDLFYRINVVEIYIPALRNRKADIPGFTALFLREFNDKYHLAKTLDPVVLQIFNDLEWKGNVRELRHMIERLVVTIDDPVITAAHLPSHIQQPVPLPVTAEQSKTLPIAQTLGFTGQMELYESSLVRDAYEVCGSSRKMAAYLKISQTKANHLIQKYIRNA